MGTLYLVRHGQASFGADNYDQLSALGQRQCEALGRYLLDREIRPAAILSGTLRRHRQSLDALAQGFGPGLPPVLDWPGLDEYDSLALIQALPDPQGLPPPHTAEGYKAHFRRLRQALRSWSEGRIHPEGMPSFDQFRAGVLTALDHVRARHVGQPVLVMSSGGPISVAMAHVVGAAPTAFIDLNMRMRNSSLTEFVFNAHKQELVAFNSVPHLDQSHTRDWITHA